MDMTSIIGGITAITAAKDAALAALAVRDFNKAAAELSKINDALLKAQNDLLGQSAALHQLQSENFQLAEKLRKLEESVAERSRYSLVEIAKGSYAYQSNVVPQLGGASDPDVPEPKHYICQICIDKHLVKSVLQRLSNGQVIYWRCMNCNAGIDSGDRVPITMSLVY